MFYWVLHLCFEILFVLSVFVKLFAGGSFLKPLLDYEEQTLGILCDCAIVMEPE